MPSRNVPTEWWQTACESIDLPLCCIDLDHKFVWCNSAFEKFIGYSVTELLNKTWMEITVDEDVGGDMASIESLKGGTGKDHFARAKRYRHKFGHILPLRLTVWRFPRSIDRVLMCFIIEVDPKRVDQKQIEKIIESLESRLDSVEEKQVGVNVDVNVGNRQDQQIGDGDRVGRDKIKNDASIIKYLIGGLVAVAIVLTWTIYYVTTMNKPDMPEKPSITIPIE